VLIASIVAPTMVRFFLQLSFCVGTLKLVAVVSRQTSDVRSDLVPRMSDGNGSRNHVAPTDADG